MLIRWRPSVGELTAESCTQVGGCTWMAVPTTDPPLPFDPLSAAEPLTSRRAPLPAGAAPLPAGAAPSAAGAAPSAAGGEAAGGAGAAGEPAAGAASLIVRVLPQPEAPARPQRRTVAT